MALIAVFSWPCPLHASRLFPSGKQQRIQDSSCSPTLPAEFPAKSGASPRRSSNKRHLPRGGSSCLVSLPAGEAERARCQRCLLARPSLPPPRMRLVFSVHLCQHGPGWCWADCRSLSLPSPEAAAAPARYRQGEQRLRSSRRRAASFAAEKSNLLPGGL